MNSNQQKPSSNQEDQGCLGSICGWFCCGSTPVKEPKAIVVRRRKPRNPNAFPFKNLPLVLKFSVLDSVHPDETLKFLKVNRYLRGHSLHYGPIRGKIDQVLVIFDAFIETNDSQYTLYPHFVVAVHLNRRALLKFFISDKLFKIENENMSDARLGNSIWTLLNKIRLTKVVSLQPGFFHFQGDPEMNDQALALKLEAEERSIFHLEKAFGGHRFMPRLRKTAVFRFRSAGLQFSKILLDNFDHEVTDCLILNSTWEDAENKEAQDYFVDIMQRPNFQYCKFYSWVVERPFTMEMWKTFAKTQGRMLMNEGLTWSDFQESAKIFLEHGIPSREEEAVVEIRSQVMGLSRETFTWPISPEELFENLLDLIYKFDGMQRITEDDLEARSILELNKKFMENNKRHFESPFKEEKVNHRKEDKAIYRKRFSDERDCIYYAMITEKRGENFGYLDVRMMIKYVPNYRL